MIKIIHSILAAKPIITMNPIEQLEICRNLLDQYLTLSNSKQNSDKIQGISLQLTIFTKRQFFPELAIHMLTYESLGNQRQMLLTSLLKNKFKYDYQLLDSQKIPIYYSGLCDVAKKSQNSNYPTFSNIVQCFAYIYINTVAAQQLALEQFVEPFLPGVPEDFELYNFYFKILEQVSAELDNLKIVVDDNGRQLAKTRIAAQQIQIINSLNLHGQRAWGTNGIKNDYIMESFVSWCEMGNEIIPQIPHHYITGQIIETLQGVYQSETALECFRALILLIKTDPQDKDNNGLFSPSQAPLLEYIGSHMVGLSNQLDRLIERKRYQQAQEFLAVLLQFLNKAARLLIPAEQNSSHILLTKILGYTLNDCLQVYYEVMQFWQTFLEQIIKIRPNNHSLLLLMDKLYDVVCERCRYQNQHIFLLNSKSQTKLQQNIKEQTLCRESSNQFLQKLSVFKGKAQYLAFVVEKIQNLKMEDELFWSHLEVRLFTLIEPMERIKVITEHAVLLVNTFSQLKNMDAPVIVTKIFLKVFKSFLSNHHDNQVFVQKLFFFVSGCFGVRFLSGIAQKAFCKGCENNGDLMCANAEQLIVLVEHYPNHQSIIKGIISLLCSNEEAFLRFMPRVLSTLMQLGQKKPQNPQINQNYYVRQSMKALSIAFGVLTQHPIATIHCHVIKDFVKKSWNFLMSSLVIPLSLDDDQDPQVQRTVKVFKRIMRCIKLQFAQFLPQLFNAVLQAFKIYPVCSYLYLLEIAVTVFSSQQQFSKYILGLYQTFFQIAFNHLSEAKYIQKYSLLLDDFLGMHKRFFMYNATIILQSGKLPKAIQVCVNLMACKSPRISKAVYSFFETLFMVYWPDQFINQYNEKNENQKLLVSHKDKQLHMILKPQIMSYMEYIIAKMIQHLSAVPPEATKQVILDALIAQIKGFPDDNQTIWTTVLSELPSDIMLVTQKERFVSLVAFPGRVNRQDSEKSVIQLSKQLLGLNRRLNTAAKRQSLQM